MHDDAALVAELNDLRRENDELRAENRRLDADYCEMRDAFHSLVTRTPSRVLAAARLAADEALGEAQVEVEREAAGHMELVTAVENWRRGVSTSAENFGKTHCQNGHEFTPENTRRFRGKNRQCITCKREYDRRRYTDRRAS